MIDEIQEYEPSSLQYRVFNLEQQVIAQRNEIACLRDTLEDTLQRLTELETHDKKNKNRSQKKSDKTMSLSASNGHTTFKTSNSLKDIRPYRDRPTGQFAHETLQNKMTSSSVQRQPVNSVPSQLPLRRSVYYQSTTSLHSDSLSSSSVSPVPSSSPRGTPLPTTRLTAIKSTDQLQNSLRKAKRWSSTGDFTHSPSTPGNNPQLSSSKLFTTTKSLLNLFKPSSPNNIKHSTREMEFNEEECTIHMYFENHLVNLHVPSRFCKDYDPHKVNVAPQTKLKLDWVYGYRGRDCRNNLHLLPTGEVVYFVASVVILYNTEEHSQRHYLGHNGNIKCIAIHPNKLVVATGQSSSLDRRETTAHIRIWNSVSLLTLRIIGDGEFGKSISCLSFSKAEGGNFLAIIDEESSDYNISIWEWQKSDRGFKLTETKCSVDTVVCAEWHPLDKNQIVTCGKGHISFWNLDNSGLLYKRMGLFESREKPKYITCLAFNQDGDVLTGDSNGNIIIWARGTNTITKVIRTLHDGSIFAMCVLKDGTIMTGGGKDGRIVLLDISLTVIQSETQEQAQSVCFSPNGTVMVVGCVSGKWLVIDSETRELYCHYNDGSEPLQVVKFSPDGTLLALGSRDNNIYIYQVNDDSTKYSRVGRCMGHSSYITHLDWSLDAQYLRSNSKNYELLYWNAGVCRQIAQGSFLKDADWATHSCIISFETIGIWHDGFDKIEINSCSRSEDGGLLAVGDSLGKVKLFSYPACQPKSLFHNYNGHFNNVTNIAFLHDDTRLISNGGTDTSILQWIVN
ncbi:echinoderm microtubule-associated protein-like 2 isoform X7 [Nasonia vitripennis]|uniref:EML-like first beta-propeller domain-containing protein n=1 Tax=Nasonia vitripennis TaxID=7425 RepID=A0A7M7TA05_NASVI|nr:echinoderm microtubule-associated protein-like 2 isoform X7 [Nasonia vitripennis]